MKKKRMSHKKKLHLARTMMSSLEIKYHVSPFSCFAWKKRKARVAKQHMKKNSKKIKA